VVLNSTKAAACGVGRFDGLKPLNLARDRRRFDHGSAFEPVEQFRPVSVLINVVVDGSTMRTSLSGS